MKVKMKADFLYEGKTFKKGEEYDKDKLPARLLNDNYVEFLDEEESAGLEKIPLPTKLVEQVKNTDAAKAPASTDPKPTA
ncbi:hypothetical protein [Chamaesiphon sp. OTE_8_metabat_110]|uniref:hypothetical protein n=1 Tax=Chamaesiphon sp. OTE_8_metabat_110 TaxID=2964696 RepID=UPI00286C7B89|nr:hypothetical protein [Chamaesiphon sp. OTE_8_metabat_110]